MSVKICGVRFCQETVHAKGYCRPHYNRFHRYRNVYEYSNRRRFCDICAEELFIENGNYPVAGTAEDDGWLKADRWLHMGALWYCYGPDRPEVATYRGERKAGTIGEIRNEKPYMGDIKPPGDPEVKNPWLARVPGLQVPEPPQYPEGTAFRPGGSTST